MKVVLVTVGYVQLAVQCSIDGTEQAQQGVGSQSRGEEGGSLTMGEVSLYN